MQITPTIRICPAASAAWISNILQPGLDIALSYIKANHIWFLEVAPPAHKKFRCRAEATSWLARAEKTITKAREAGALELAGNRSSLVWNTPEDVPYYRLKFADLTAVNKALGAMWKVELEPMQLLDLFELVAREYRTAVAV
jgi:hypothetical protein